MQLIRAAVDERDLYAFRSAEFQKLNGNNNSKYSLRLIAEWRLHVEVTSIENNQKLVILCISNATEEDEQ